MAALPFLVIGGAVWFVAMLLTAFSQASSSTTRPAGEASGLLSGLTWATDLLGQAWHRLVRSTVSRFAEGHLVPLVRWFSSLNALVLGVSQAIADVAEEVAAAIERVARVTVPREAKRAAKPALVQAKGAQKTATHATVTARTAVGSVTRLRSNVVPRVRTAEKAIAVTLPQEIAHVNDRVKGVEHELRFPSNATVKRWANRLWVGGLAALFIRTLVRRFPWLFCRKVKQLGPRICGLDDALFDALLVGTLAVASTVSLVDMANELLDLEDDIVRAVTGFFRELQDVPRRSAAEQGF